MSLSCDCDFGDAEWWYESPDDFSVLSTKRSRKCCSCKAKIRPGAMVLRLQRWRPPSDRCNYIEESIYGDEVPLAPWFLCETCGGLLMSIEELGMCCDISENIASQIREYRAEEKYAAESHARYVLAHPELVRPLPPPPKGE